MFSSLNEIINTIGLWNLFSIITFIFGSFFTLYTYFKSFYRIVYSYTTICEDYVDLKDWINESKIKKTRVIFKNNGRKSITNNEVKSIKIKGNNFQSFKYSGLKKINNTIDNNKIELKIDYLDSNDFFIIEFEHTGKIEIKGRIAETGEFLNTETKSWLYINFFLVLYSLISMAVIPLISLMSLDYIEIISRTLINLIVIYLILLVARYLHKVFFISDAIVDKYLGTTNKWNRAFKNSL